jgi:hypothetical protein
LTDFSDTAFGLSGQGNSGLSLKKTAMTSAQITSSAVSPSIVFNTEIAEEEKQWFPMRIAYGRKERTLGIKSFLDENNVENFLPMTCKKQLVNGHPKRVLVPALDGLIFIRTSEEHLVNIKRHCQMLLPLRFLMWTPHNEEEPSHIITIPVASMNNFMRVASIDDERVMFLPNTDFSHKIGRKVQVTDGIFAGVQGTVLRVKKDRRVVVTLDQVCSVAIAYINPSYLREM